MSARDPGLHRRAVHIFAEENPERKENKASGLGVRECLIECEKGREAQRKKNTCIALFGFCLWSAIVVGLKKAKRLKKMRFIFGFSILKLYLLYLLRIFRSFRSKLT